MVYAFTIDPTTFPAARVKNIGSLVSLALPLALTGAALVFLVVTLKGAFDILTNGNNPDALKKAYGSITMAFIGLIIVIGSFLAIKILEVVLHTSIIPK